MEDHALTPPAWLERAVLALIPPLARETVAGDLCEIYESPRQYAREAARTIPFVIVSQMRRNLNAPALLVQLALADALLGPMTAALLLPVLLLRDAWQPVARPSAHDAIRGTMIIALLAMIAVQALAMNVNLMLSTGLNRANWISLYFFGFLVAPLLCILRIRRSACAPAATTSSKVRRWWLLPPSLPGGWMGKRLSCSPRCIC